MCNDLEKTLDLQMYYVECGIEYTNAFGDISERFYYSMGKMYETVINSLIEAEDPLLIQKFMPRLEKAVSGTEEIGWGFHEDLYSSFLQIIDCEE